MTVLLVDATGRWRVDEIPHLTPFVEVPKVRILCQLPFMIYDEVVWVRFRITHKVDFLGRYVYRQMGYHEVPIRYPRTELPDDLDHALHTIVEREQEKELNRGLNDFLGGLPD